MGSLSRDHDKCGFMSYFYQTNNHTILFRFDLMGELQYYCFKNKTNGYLSHLTFHSVHATCDAQIFPAQPTWQVDISRKKWSKGQECFA